MTIKQQGGVFGRNPTFNDATVDEITIDGLRIYFDGTRYMIASPSTEFRIQTSDFRMVNSANNEVGLKVVENGAAALYWDGASRLATADAGVQITGNVIMNNGKGIDFSATAGTGTSELFDDYEEGTWTATVGCTGNATTTTTVTAYYTKIGRQVTVGFRLLNNIDTTGLSGFFQIQGLPYACITGSTAGFAGIADWSDLTYPASVDTVTPVTSNGASTIVFSTRGSGIAGGLLGATQPTSGVTDIAHLALTYFTA